MKKILHFLRISAVPLLALLLTTSPIARLHAGGAMISMVDIEAIHQHLGEHLILVQTVQTTGTNPGGKIVVDPQLHAYPFCTDHLTSAPHDCGIFSYAEFTNPSIPLETNLLPIASLPDQVAQFQVQQRLINKIPAPEFLNIVPLNDVALNEMITGEQSWELNDVVLDNNFNPTYSAIQVQVDPNVEEMLEEETEQVILMEDVEEMEAAVAMEVPADLLQPGAADEPEFTQRQSIAAAQLSVAAWPNPSSGAFTVQANAATGAAVEIVVTDLGGKVIGKWTALPGIPASIDLTQQPSGTYLLKTQSTEGHAEIVRLVIQH